MKIMTFAEQRGCDLKKPSLEALSAARSVGGEDATVIAVLLGMNVEPLAATLGEYGADQVLLGSDPIFERYSSDAYGLAMKKAVGLESPDLILFPATSMGKDLAPTVAGKLDAPLVSDCVEVRMDGGRPIFKRPIFAGKAFVEVKPKGTPVLATLRPNAFSTVPQARPGVITPLDHGVEAGAIRALVEKIVDQAGDLPDVAEADIIVSGGRGMKGPENFPLLNDLARAIGGAAVGASRAAVDAGWIDHSHQVGQTGKVVGPSLYIACGISGAIQHLAGMSSSKTIVAINKDPEAPIFKVADVGIVGDLFEVVPLLVNALEARKAG